LEGGFLREKERNDTRIVSYRTPFGTLELAEENCHVTFLLPSRRLAGAGDAEYVGPRHPSRNVPRCRGEFPVRETTPQGGTLLC
jgi:hypothetical protein